MASIFKGDHMSQPDACFFNHFMTVADVCSFSLQCAPLSLAEFYLCNMWHQTNKTTKCHQILFWPIVVYWYLLPRCHVSHGRDFVSGPCSAAATAAVNTSSHNQSDECQEEQQDDEEGRLCERVLLRKCLQFGPDVLENSHHIL